MQKQILAVNDQVTPIIQAQRKAVSQTGDIHDFYTFRLKNDGQYKIMQSSENIKNTYCVLRDLGFGYVIINKKRVYYLLSGKNIMVVQMDDLKSAFISYLKHTEFSDIPTGISLYDLTSWYDGKSIVNDNKLLTEYLRNILPEDQMNHLKAKLDPSLNQLYEVRLLLDKLNDWGFQKTINRVFSNSIFRPLNPLYFKPIGNNRYLIMDHCNIKHKAQECLDCYLATYKNGHQVGLKKPLSANRIKMCFNLERDYKLIEDMLVQASVYG